MSRLLLATILFSAVTVSNSFACSALFTRDWQEQFKNTELVFRGLVTKTELLDGQDLLNEPKTFYYSKVYFKPLEILKGEVSDTDYFIGFNGYGGACAASLLVGSHFLITLSDQEKLAAISEEEKANREKNPELYRQMDLSRGSLSLFNATALPNQKPGLDKNMQIARDLVKKEKE